MHVRRRGSGARRSASAVAPSSGRCVGPVPCVCQSVRGLLAAVTSFHRRGIRHGRCRRQRPDTVQALAGLFAYPVEGEARLAAFNTLEQSVTDVGEPTVRLANRTFPDVGFSTTEGYDETLARWSGAGIEPLPLQTDAGGSRERIKDWVADQTEGLRRQRPARARGRGTRRPALPVPHPPPDDRNGAVRRPSDGPVDLSEQAPGAADRTDDKCDDYAR